MNASGWSAMMKWRAPSTRSSRTSQVGVLPRPHGVGHGGGRAAVSVSSIDGPHRRGHGRQTRPQVGRHQVAHGRAHGLTIGRHGPRDHGGPRRLIATHAPGQGLLACAKGVVVRGEHGADRLFGHGRGGLRGDGRAVKRAEVRQGVHAHHPADQVGPLLRQQHARRAAHGMADDRRPLQSRRLDVARDLGHGRAPEVALAMRPRLPRETGQLHQMQPVIPGQRLGGGPPHLPRGGHAGDQDHVGADSGHLHADAVGREPGRGVGDLGLGPSGQGGSGADRQGDQRAGGQPPAP